MSENLRDLAAELTRVDTAIHDVPLYADPTDPTSSFSDELIELVAREEELVGELIRQARQEIADDRGSLPTPERRDPRPTDTVRARRMPQKGHP